MQVEQEAASLERSRLLSEATAIIQADLHDLCIAMEKKGHFDSEAQLRIEAKGCFFRLATKERAFKIFSTLTQEYFWSETGSYDKTLADTKQAISEMNETPALACKPWFEMGQDQ